MVEEEKEKTVFACDQCPQVFRTKFNLKRHVKDIHYQPLRVTVKHIKKDNKYEC